jgi:hypothetical protein
MGEPAQRAATKPSKRQRKRIPPPEEVWVKGFVEFTGTTNVTAFCASDLGGVNLTRVVEALRMGSMVWANKCNGSGSICAFQHAADEQDVVEVLVWFEANEEKLEIREARRIKEDDSEPHAA